MDAEFYNFILINKNSSQTSDLFFPTWEFYVCRYTHDVFSILNKKTEMRKTNKSNEALQYTNKSRPFRIELYHVPSSVQFTWGAENLEDNVVRPHITTSRPILVKQQHDGNSFADENRVLQEGLFCLDFYCVLVLYSCCGAKNWRTARRTVKYVPYLHPSLV